MDISNIISHLVPITRFNQGQASKYFQRVHAGESFVVIKNNMPIAVIISPDEYKLLQDLKRTCKDFSKGFDNSGSKGEIVRLITQIEKYDEVNETNV